MQKEKTINLNNKKYIPTVISATKAYGDLPKSRSDKTYFVLEVLLNLSKNNIVNQKISQLAQILDMKVPSVHTKMRVLEKYNFIKNITPKGLVASNWEINQEKLKILTQSYLDAQRLRKKFINRTKKPE